jgi:hypothetical protein
MKTIEVLTLALFCFSMTTTGFSQSQAEVRAKMNKDIIKKEKTMKTYVIERDESPDRDEKENWCFERCPYREEHKAG